MEPLLAFENVIFHYDPNKPVLEDVSVEVGPGEIVWLRGPNGAGKSTLLRIAAQLLRPQAGNVRFRGQLLSHRSRGYAEAIAYVPAEPYLFDYLTGRENAEFIRYLFSIPRDDMDAWMQRAEKEFGLVGALDRFVKEYSLGMRHKLYWAMMLARSVLIFLLDEPFSPLDHESRTAITQELKARVEQGAAVIFTTHVDELAAEFSTREVWLRDGRIFNAGDVGD
ncbi:MAG: ABC transporter ATP-binding protein [Alicyclobacillus mali]|uniref:ABC transporter ATP-binding protein n=1 Tax=Alicyclobacillus mali (ex Roth et al. 2021) TaxID=1123961 RepID=UPI00082E0BAC|nr:ABC transporter ATP-binding protein [Alicyclobacillus mali (ex Roth et al. 2021)]MCL6488570.1 ABC transporter ATP-binding protein [Alicyclobacillus mali (ex Roth et al. 2021)]